MERVVVPRPMLMIACAWNVRFKHEMNRRPLDFRRTVSILGSRGSLVLVLKKWTVRWLIRGPIVYSDPQAVYDILMDYFRA